MSTEIQLFRKRLNDIVEEIGLDAETISKGTNIHISTIYRYLKGDINDLKMSNIFKLANYLHVSPIWLAGWSDDKDAKPNSVESNAFPVTDTPKKVPVVGKISAGLPILAVENIEGYEYAPSSFIKEGYEYFYLRVQGDSMNLKINNGDIVLVQKQDYLEDGEIGVILVNGFDATVKKYKVENGLVILEPMSTNPANAVQVYNPKDIEIKIIGKVVSYQGKID